MEIGFAYMQVMLLGVGDGTKANVYGAQPYVSSDPLTPNEAYFQHVDAVVEIARQKNVIISMTVFHQRYRNLITVDNARAWGKWLAERYREVPALVWSSSPEAQPEFVPVLQELAAGLREGDAGAHLITTKPDPSPYSSSFLHEEEWLDFNAMQTWTSVQLIYPMVTHDYHLRPTNPVVMAEGAYEAGSEYDFEVTPLWVRRQAYYSYLAGAHHTYGHNDSWRVLPTWREALNAPGARQLGLLKQIFQARQEWWELVPDQSLLASGSETEGRVLTLSARHREGRWAMVYCAEETAFSLTMNKFVTPHVHAFWVDPRNAQATEIGSLPTTGVESFTTPPGLEDAALSAGSTSLSRHASAADRRSRGADDYVGAPLCGRPISSSFAPLCLSG